jgi:hypothetical protein
MAVFCGFLLAGVNETSHILHVRGEKAPVPKPEFEPNGPDYGR